MQQLPAVRPCDHADLARFPTLLFTGVADRPAHHVVEAHHPGVAKPGFVEVPCDQDIAIAHVYAPDAQAITTATAGFRCARHERVTAS